MKRLFSVTALCISMIACFAQTTPSEDNQPQQDRKLIYCSCAYYNYGLPEGEISHSFYELVADKGVKPYVRYCEERGGEPYIKKYPATENDVTELYKILLNLKIEELNGYKHNMEMTGGTSYRIHVEFDDGNYVTATWFTQSPKPEAFLAYETILRYLGNKAK